MVPPPGLALDAPGSEDERARSRAISSLIVPWLRPADLAQIAYHSLILFLILGAFAHLEVSVRWLIFQQVATLAVVPLLASGTVSRHWWRRRVADWYHLVLIPITFHELMYLVPAINPVDQDAALAVIDQVMFFGSHPTVLLEGMLHPLLTEILQVCYGAYYVLPVVLGVCLAYRGQKREFSISMFGTVTCFALTYVGYFLVPALGPRFYLAMEQTVPLEGLVIYETLRDTLNDLEGVMRDCFPSGHCAVTLVVMHFAWRYYRPIFWLFLLPSIGLVFSTVYLRYHYVIDVFAGIALYAFVVACIPRAYDFWERHAAGRSGSTQP